MLLPKAQFNKQPVTPKNILQMASSLTIIENHSPMVLCVKPPLKYSYSDILSIPVSFFLIRWAALIIKPF